MTPTTPHKPTARPKTAAPLLDVQNLHVSFQVGNEIHHAVRGVSFHINPGQTVALVGESGSGKSVSALSSARLLPNSASHPHGNIIFNGSKTLGDDRSAQYARSVRGSKIGFVFQEPMSALNPLHRIGKQVAEALTQHGTSKIDASRRVPDLLRRVQLPNPQRIADSWPHQLSGGQRQRALIAMAVANNPALLIADEPTTALDVTVESQILQLLQSLQQETHMSLLLITHDLSVARRLADHIYVMQNGLIVEHGAAQDLFSNPRRPYTKDLLNAAQSPPPPPTPPPAEPVLRAENLHVRFPVHAGIFRRVKNYVHAVNNVSLSLRPGHTTALVGESGSGKTTVGLALLKLLPSQNVHGPVVFLGQNLQSLKPRAVRNLRKHIQIVFQDPFGSLNPRMNAESIVTEGLRALEHLSAAQLHQRACDAFRDVALDPKSLPRYPHEFSGGQRQRIAVARAVALKPRVLVLDEPTSALDVTVRKHILQLLLSLQQRHNVAYLFISHDLKTVRGVAHSIAVMQNGHVVEQGDAHNVLNNPQHPYTQTLLNAAFPPETIVSEPPETIASEPPETIA